MQKPRMHFVVRHWLVLVVLLGAFVALAARAVDLQVSRMLQVLEEAACASR